MRAPELVGASFEPVCAAEVWRGSGMCDLANPLEEAEGCLACPVVVLDVAAAARGGNASNGLDLGSALGVVWSAGCDHSFSIFFSVREELGIGGRNEGLDSLRDTDMSAEREESTGESTQASRGWVMGWSRLKRIVEILSLRSLLSYTVRQNGVTRSPRRQLSNSYPKRFPVSYEHIKRGATPPRLDIGSPYSA